MSRLGQNLVRFGLQRAVLMNLIFIGLVVAGLYVATGFGLVPSSLRVDRYPNFNLGEADVTTWWGGATADEVERLVTRPLEDATRGVDAIEFVRASSRDGLSELHIKFRDGLDFERAYDDLRIRVQQAAATLPAHDGKPLQPTVTKMETDVWLPVAQVNLLPATGAVVSRERMTAAARDLRDRLEIVSGMKRIDLEGLSSDRFEIVLDPEALDREGLTVAEVAERLRASGVAMPAGEGTAGGAARTIITDARWRSPADIWAVPIRNDQGRVLTLAQVARVGEARLRPAADALRIHLNGQPTISLKLLKDRDADAVRIKAQVQPIVEAFLATNRDLRMVWSLDSTVRIDESINVLQGNLFQGALLILAVMVVMLSWRMAVLASTGVLFAFLGVVLFLHLSGNSLNEITLLGLVLVAGILDDDVIVVVDNIQRKREEGLRGTEAIIAGAGEVILPLTAASLTTISAFLPMLLMGGAVGQFFAMLPITVAIALAISLIECVFMVPLHIHDLDCVFGEERAPAEAVEGLPVLLARKGVIGAVHRIYDHALRFAVDRPWMTMAGVGAMLLLSIGILVQSAMGPSWGQRPLLKLAFFPEDTSVFNITIRLPSDSSLDTTDALAKSVASEVSRFCGNDVSAVSGLSGIAIDQAYRPVWGRSHAILLVELAPRAQRQREPQQLLDQLRGHIEAEFERGGVQITVTAQKDGPPTDAPVVVRLGGTTLAAVSRAAAAVRAHLVAQSASTAPLAGIIDLSANDEERSTVIRVIPDAVRAARFGLSSAQVVSAVAAANAGLFVGELHTPIDERPVIVRLPPERVADPAGMLDVVVARDAGRLVRVGDVATSRVEDVPASLVRRDYRRTVTITANLSSTAAIGSFHVAHELERWWKEQAATHPGVSLAFGGEAESTSRSYRTLALSFVVAVVLIFAILATQFGSVWQPLLVMGNIIYAIIGVVVTMGAFGALAMLLPEGAVRPERAMLTVQSFMAVIGLTGMVIGESIVLVEFINLRLRDGLSPREALMTAGHQRLRPIFMATTTTIAGLLTMAIGIPDYSMAWSPMAQCFVAGLTISTALTLIAVPALYGIGLRLTTRRR